MKADTRLLQRAPNQFHIGKHKLVLKPLNDVAITALDDWVRQEHIENVVRSAKNMAPADRDRLESIALKQSLTMTFMSGLGAQCIATPRGIAKLLQVMAGGDEVVEHEELISAMFDPANVEQVWAKFRELNVNGMGGAAGGSPPEEKKKKRSKRLKKKTTKHSSKRKNKK